jgi:hypothetical protein
MSLHFISSSLNKFMFFHSNCALTLIVCGLSFVTKLIFMNYWSLVKVNCWSHLMNYWVWLWKDVGVEDKIYFCNLGKQVIKIFSYQIKRKKKTIQQFFFWSKYKFKELTMKKIFPTTIGNNNFHNIKKCTKTS